MGKDMLAKEYVKLWHYEDLKSSLSGAGAAGGTGGAGAAGGTGGAVEGHVSVHLKFEPFFHSHVAEFIRGLNRKGIPGLLNLTNQTLGNPYLHSPWKFDLERMIPTDITGPACFIEGGFGKNQTRPGNFEAVIPEGNKIWHYTRDNSSVTNPWIRGQQITDQDVLSLPASITERISTRIVGSTFESGYQVFTPGNFEVVVLQKDNELHQYSLDNSDPASSWKPTSVVTKKATGPGCIIESDFLGSTGAFSLEVVVLENGDLVHYRRNDKTNEWIRQDPPITHNATGPGCIIQSSFLSGDHKVFEVVVLEGNDLVHYSKNHVTNEWLKVANITDSATSPGSIIQGRVSDSFLHGNFEVIVCEGEQLVHYWKDNSDTSSPWRRGQIITTNATAPGCLIHGSFGKIVGNFELMVPEENGRLAHYWNVNEGLLGSEGERFYFSDTYAPTKNVDDPYPRHDLDFSYGGAYSVYNWEIFFHAPMMLATQLSRNQRFADAMHWYHYIFDPTDDSIELTTHRYWKFLPFRDVNKQRVDQMLKILVDEKMIGKVERQKIVDQIEDCTKHPFKPHRVARLRQIAYQKTIVMKYIDNLIAWGDQLFRRSTIESINEATQLYILAANVLGRRPERIPERAKVKPKTYAELQPDLVEFGLAKQALENDFPLVGSVTYDGVVTPDESKSLLGIGDTLYFCIPRNDKLLEYWDTVGDRLFKIRHCMNIEGVVRQLPLFEPPIDPALLVRASAMGVDLASVLSDLSAPLPNYRFRYMLQKANEVCAELRSLGAALLAALEKKDAEAIATVRAKHETEILSMVLLVKNNQLEESKAAKTALESSRKIAVTRYLHYQTLLGVEDPKEPKPSESISEYVPSAPLGLTDEEGLKVLASDYEEMEYSKSASDKHTYAQFLRWGKGAAALLPDASADLHFWGVGAHIVFGGSALASNMESAAEALELMGSIDQQHSYRAGKRSSFILRERDWSLNNNLAAKEIMQIDKQLVAADIRIAIANQEIINHNKQIENAQFIEEFLRSKYSNEELYRWMQGEISAIYFQCYQFAYDLAKRAERCYRFERGITDSDFIQFGYWDSLRKGLLTGERLYLALKQMEIAYDNQNKRDYEITKNISLVLYDPLALINLKENGECIVNLREPLFDADYPGHFMRRIKSASLTIPCIVGAYTSINCTLTLLNNSVRVSNNAQTDYEPQGEDDSRFITNFASLQSIATSHAQNDSGMFELNFHDERYLPFEGAGAISRWRIELPKGNNAFDLNTVSDVILKLNYTAREGGDQLRQKAKAATSISSEEILMRIFSARHEFPTEWYQFLNPTDPNSTAQTLKFDMSMERFPFLMRGKTIQIEQVNLFLKFVKTGDNVVYGLSPSPLGVSLKSDGTTGSGSLLGNRSLQGMPYLRLDFSTAIPSSIALEAKEDDIKKIASDLQEKVGDHQRLKSDSIADIFIICKYSATEPPG